MQAAQNLALRHSHQQFTPEHMLKALLEDEEGLCSNLIGAAGGNAAAASAAVDQALAKLPKVSGANAQPMVTPELARLFDNAQQIAKKAGDLFVTVERLLLALAMASSSASADALKRAGVTPQKLLNQAINEIRKGRTADSASAEFGLRRRRTDPPPISPTRPSKASSIR